MTVQERLLKQYRKSYEALLERIAQKEARGSWTGFERQLLREIEKAVKELDQATAREFPKLVEEAYTKATADAADILSRAHATPMLGGGLNRRAMALLMQNAVDAMVSANHYFGRHVQDSIRQIGLDAVAEKLSTGQTIRQAQKRIVEQLTQDGMQAVVGTSGRKMRLETYAELVARTTTRETTNTATVDTARQWGNDLVKFTTHYPTCEVCAPVQGRVFSISGQDQHFPALNSVPGFDRGFKTIHPNCRHVLVPIVWALCSEEEKARYRADAGKPVKGDTRLQKEVERYNRAQEINRQRWADRRQYERYKARLGDDAPKNFSGFRAMKRAGSEKWVDLQQKYKRVGRENAIIKAARETGGRHSGKYADASSWSDTSVQKAANSYAAQVLEHELKIRQPAAYDKGWSKKTPEQQNGLLNKWQKDRARNDELRIIMESILKERGLL